MDDKGQRMEAYFHPRTLGACATGLEGPQGLIAGEGMHPFVRVAHWSLAACVLAAWITAELEAQVGRAATSGSATRRSP